VHIPGNLNAARKRWCFDTTHATRNEPP
jgi:hypothetical protein